MKLKLTEMGQLKIFLGPFPIFSYRIFDHCSFRSQLLAGMSGTQCGLLLLYSICLKI